MNYRHSIFAVLLGLMFAGGCAPYVEDYYYAPHPAVAEIRPKTAPPTTTQPATAEPAPQRALVTTVATVVGIRRADPKVHLPLSIEVRLRIDNHGPQAIDFDPATLELTTPDLLVFPPPILQPPGPSSLAPGQTLIAIANFPFPAKASYANTNLRSLQLHWATTLNGKLIPQQADFHRTHRYYYDPYWGYPMRPYYGAGYPYPYWYPSFGIGGTVIIRR